MFGIKQFEAVINPPQGMILAVGAGDKRPYVIDDGALANRHGHERPRAASTTARSTARKARS